MAAIHPDVQNLLTPLLESPLAPFGQRALLRIQSDDYIISPDDRVEGEYADRDQSPRGRGLRQLALLHETVAMPLKLELALCERLAEIAPEFEIDAINVFTEGIDGRTELSVDRLLSTNRRKAILAFLDVWLALWEETRNSVGGEGEGEG